MKRLFSHLIFVIFSTLASFTFAGPSEALPPDMQVVDNYLGEPNWLQSFGELQTLGMTFEETAGKKNAAATPYQIRSELINPDTAKISNLDEKGQLTSSFDLQNSEWQRQHGNWIRFFIERSESFGFKIKIEQITKSVEKVEVNGSVLTLDALQVRTSGENKMGWMITQTYVISNKLRGLGQLLLREETQSIMGQKVRRSHQVLSISEH